MVGWMVMVGSGQLWVVACLLARVLHKHKLRRRPLLIGYREEWGVSKSLDHRGAHTTNRGHSVRGTKRA